MCRKQMLPHDFWVFVLMMSSTRLSFNPVNGGSAWFKVWFYGWSSGFQSCSSPRAILKLFYTAWLYIFTLQSLFGVEDKSASLPHIKSGTVCFRSKPEVLSHSLQSVCTSHKTIFQNIAQFVLIDLLPARPPLIAIHFTAIWKLTWRDLKIFRER